MASIRNRSPWRVSVLREIALGGRFPSKKQAHAGGQRLTVAGHNGVQCVHESEVSWDMRVRRRGLPELGKSFPTKRIAREWADAGNGEIVEREFVDYREADRHTLGEVLKRYDDGNPPASGRAAAPTPHLPRSTGPPARRAWGRRHS